MRGVYHSSRGIETFLRQNPVAYPRRDEINNLARFTGKGTQVFWEMLLDGPGRPPTNEEFVARYMSIQRAEDDTSPNRARMRQLYIGFMRDYHAGSMLLEHPLIDHVFFDPVLDADCGIDYITASQGGYSGIRVLSPGKDKFGWDKMKGARKAHLRGMFSPVYPLQAASYASVGGVCLCRREDVDDVQKKTAENGAHRQEHDRLWVELKLMGVGKCV